MKKAHLLRCRVRSSLRRAWGTPALRFAPSALHLDLFDQPSYLRRFYELCDCFLAGPAGAAVFWLAVAFGDLAPLLVGLSAPCPRVGLHPWPLLVEEVFAGFFSAWGGEENLELGLGL
jgi:hypothetical protein